MTETAETAAAVTRPDAAKRGRLAALENDRLYRGVQNGWITTKRTAYNTIDQLSGAFVTDTDTTDIALTLSADTYVDTRARRMYVRAIVDGRVLDPGSVIFATGEDKGSRSFVFRGTVGPGAHIVQIMWRSDSTNAAAKMRNAALLLRTSPRVFGVSSIAMTGKNTWGDDTHAGAAWRSVSNARANAFVVAGQDLEVSFAAEMYTANSAPLYLRVLVDGGEVAPGLFRVTSYEYRQARTIGVTATGLAQGFHTVQVEARTIDGGRGFIGKRSLVTNAVDRSASNHTNAYRSVSSWSATRPSTSWQGVPHMSKTIDVPPNGEVAVQFTADVRTSNNKTVYFRMRIDGETTGVHTVQTADDRFGLVHRTFVLKGLNATPNTVRRTARVEWKTVGGGTASIGPRAINIAAERGELPDTFGKSRFSSTWPTRGTRKLLVLLVDSEDDRRQLVDRATVVDALFGNHSVRDYLLEQSDSRLLLENAGVYGYYTLDKDREDYFPDMDCDDPNSRGFVSGGREIWMEILQKASRDVNFASFDINRDGELTENELGIVFVGREAKWIDGAFVGTSVNRALVNCADSPLGDRITLDGVTLKMDAASWNPQRIGQPRMFGTAAHELSHLFFHLPDMYQQNLSVPTEPGNFSMMANDGPTSAIDPINRMHLGWVANELVGSTGEQTLEDVGYAHKVVVLPRLDGRSTEYFAIENRQEKNDGHSKYDERIGESGLAVWHVIDPLGPDSAALRQTPPRCLDALWSHANFSSSAARTGIRLVRPGVTSVGSLWKDTSGALRDRDGNAACPANGGEGTQLLEWAEGVPSGYRLTDFSGSMRNMTFKVWEGDACILNGINVCDLDFGVNLNPGFGQ